MKEMREMFADTLIEIGEKNQKLVLLEADLMNANGTKKFQDRFPSRVVNAGVAEANMVGMAAGLSAMGFIPVASTFACFASRRAYDQFFISGNYARRNIKLVGSDPGVLAALNGGTHMAFEDIALMRTIPDIVVCDPCDGASMIALVEQLIDHKGCTYMRLNRKSSTAVYDENDRDFTLGKGRLLKDGEDVTLVASGVVLVEEALKAADIFESQGVSAAVIDMHTIKPLDSDLIIKYAKKTGKIITCENHQVINGLGSAVAEVLVGLDGIQFFRIGVQGVFGQVGSVDYLKRAYGMTAESIVDAYKNKN